MKLTGGYPFWLIHDGLIQSYPRLTKNIQTNTVIIGGGISGALTAYYLINAGTECVLVDGRTIGLGSTCASTSLLQYELDEPLTSLKNKVGESTAERAYRLCGKSIDTLVEIMNGIGFKEYEKTGSLFYSTHRSEKKFIQQEFEARKKAGFHLQMLSSGELKNDYGLNARYALLSQQGCSTNAYALTHALLQYCIKKGLQVFDRTCIQSIEYKRETILKTEDDYSIKVKNIVNATGYEVVNFIPKDIVDFYCTYAIVSEHTSIEKPLWKDNVLIWSTDDPYLYMRTTKDNRIIVGGRDEPFSNAFTRQALIERKSRQLQKDFHKVLPGLPFKREFEWSGTFGKTKDSLPYIGTYKKTPGTYYALGFGGNGITFSVVAAEIIRDLLCGKPNPDAKLFSFDR